MSHYNETFKQSPISGNTSVYGNMRKTNFSLASEDSESGPKYLPESELLPVNFPEKEFKKQLTFLGASKEWNVLFGASTMIRRLCKHHP